MNKIISSGFIVIAMLLSACVSDTVNQVTQSGNRGTKTAAELKLEKSARSLNQVSKDIIVKNTVEGAVIGAAVGCGLALILGGNGADCAKGAAVGAIGGGVAGNAVGKKAASKNEQIVKRDQVLKNLTGVSQRLNTVEAQLQGVVRSQNSEIASLRRQLANGQIEKTAYSNRVKSINANRTAVKASLQKSSKNMANTSNEIRAAQRKGQTGLGGADKATVNTKARMDRTIRSIKTIAN